MKSISPPEPAASLGLMRARGEVGGGGEAGGLDRNASLLLQNPSPQLHGPASPVLGLCVFKAGKIKQLYLGSI